MEADLPDIVDYKAERLAGARPRCRLERVAVDLADGAARRELLYQVAAGRPTLVVAEGVLLYLAPEDVATLGRELAERAGFRWWLLDLSSPCFVEWFNRMFGRPLAAAGATFRFAPADGKRPFRPVGRAVSEHLRYLRNSDAGYGRAPDDPTRSRAADH